MNVMETASVVTPNGEPLWSVETVGAALKDARDRGLVILGGDVFDEKNAGNRGELVLSAGMDAILFGIFQNKFGKQLPPGGGICETLGRTERVFFAGSAGCDGSLHLCGRTVKGEAA